MQKVVIRALEQLDFRTKEAYKTLRTNLEFAGRDVKVISLTSCTPNEGKTSVSFQLALSIAESGKKVILVDADLRKSVLRGRYKASSGRYGLSHYLSGQAELQEVSCETNIENFHLIFAGPVPPNPSELLGNANFGELVKHLRETYDYVVIDTPPLGSVIDGAVVASHCDGAVLVIESGAISYKFVQRIKEQLEKADCRILGCVLNKVNLGGKGYYGKYYGRYYGKYYGNYYGQEAEAKEGGVKLQPALEKRASRKEPDIPAKAASHGADRAAAHGTAAQPAGTLPTAASAILEGKEEAFWEEIEELELDQIQDGKAEAGEEIG